jgi:hypothetical protein
MRCCHLKHKGEAWVLDLGDEGALVRDASGRVRAQFTREEAAGAFLLPSFSESIKQFRLPVDGEIWFFDVAKNDLKEIKTYINEAVVAAGPEAVLAVRNTAIRDALIGLACIIAGVGLTVWSYIRATQNPEDSGYVVTYGLVLVGLVMLGKGVYGFVRYGQLKKMSQDQAEGA